MHFCPIKTVKHAGTKINELFPAAALQTLELGSGQLSGA
jgi:hypothetical protein